MNGDISELLQGVLKDPDTMQKLMGVAKTMLSDANSLETPPEGNAQARSKDDKTEAVWPVQRKKHEPDATTAEASESGMPERHDPSQALLRMTAGNGERIALIQALRPYLSPARRQTADSLVKMLKMLKLADLNTLSRD